MLQNPRSKTYTFFFCFPPPDFAGLEDGGGAFSFLGAYTNIEITESAEMALQQ